MKYRLLAFFFLTIGSLTSLSAYSIQNDPTDLETMNLKGRVKTCIRYFYEIPQETNDITPGWKYYVTQRYTRNGMELSRIASDSTAGKLRSDGTVSLYNNIGRIIATRLLSGGPDGYSDTVIYSINNKKNLISKLYSDNKIRYQTIYNHFHQPDTIYDYFPFGSSVQKTINHYNKQHKLVEALRYDEAGLFISKEVTQYDIKGRRIELLTFEHNRLTERSQFVYDKYDNEVMRKDYDYSSYPGRTGGFYVYESPGGKENILIANSRPSKFDKHGNWLKLDIIVGGKVARSIKRRIEYYKN